MKHRENKLIYFFNLLTEKGYPVQNIYDSEVKDISTERFSEIKEENKRNISIISFEEILDKVNNSKDDIKLNISENLKLDSNPKCDLVDQTKKNECVNLEESKDKKQKEEVQSKEVNGRKEAKDSEELEIPHETKDVCDNGKEIAKNFALDSPMISKSVKIQKQDNLCKK